MQAAGMHGGHLTEQSFVEPVALANGIGNRGRRAEIEHRGADAHLNREIDQQHALGMPQCQAASRVDCEGRFPDAAFVADDGDRFSHDPPVLAPPGFSARPNRSANSVLETGRRKKSFTPARTAPQSSVLFEISPAWISGKIAPANAVSGETAASSSANTFNARKSGPISTIAN